MNMPNGQPAPRYKAGALLRAAELARHTVVVAVRYAARRSVPQVRCGSGGLLAALRTSGWRIHGIEDSSADWEAARIRYQLPVHLGTLGS